MMNDNKDLRVLSDGTIMKRLLKYVRGHELTIIFAFLLMIIAVGFEAILPLIVNQFIIELGKDDIRLAMIIFLVVLYGVLMLINYILQYIQSLSLQKMGQKVMYKIREDVFVAIESLSISQLNEIPVGKLVTRVTSDTNTLNEMYTTLIINLIRNILTIVSTIIVMFVLNVELTLLVLSVVPILIVASIIFRKYSRKAYREVRANVSNVNAFLSENLSGMKIIQVFNQEEKKYQEFSKKNNDLKKSNLKEVWTFAIFRPVIYVLYMTALTIVVYYAAKNSLDILGDVNVNKEAIAAAAALIVTFQRYIRQLFDPIQTLADQFNVMQSAFASSERIFEILDTKPTVVNEPDAIELDHIEGNIEFKNVWFAYKEGEWVLQDISFKIKAGETVAFVGATGSGKTTILSLIVRNYDIQKGQILIDGIDIRKIKIESLRKNIGQMLQDVFLFSGTIFSNIQMYDETVTLDDVKKASEYVNLSPFIEKLPNKYYEEVRERGNNFSNGQRQLLSFARTITYKPSIMILDEATANIDTETEVLIQDSLEKMRNIGTMLVVAHRLSTIQHSDKIIVIRKGKIIEEGTHQELLRNQGHYYKLYKNEQKNVENKMLETVQTLITNANQTVLTKMEENQE